MQLSHLKDDENSIIEESFNTLIKMAKILIESARDKFKLNNK